MGYINISIICIVFLILMLIRKIIYLEQDIIAIKERLKVLGIIDLDKISEWLEEETKHNE